MKIKQILLREDLHDRLKIAAINNHTSVMKLTEQILGKWINHHEAGMRQGPADKEKPKDDQDEKLGYDRLADSTIDYLNSHKTEQKASEPERIDGASVVREAAEEKVELP